MLPVAATSLHSFSSVPLVMGGRGGQQKKNNLGPVPRKMVKVNPGLRQISSTVFSSKNMQLEVTKYC